MRMSKIAVLADIHANLEALTATLNDIRDNFGEVKFMMAGDYVDYGANPSEVVKTIQNLPYYVDESGFPLIIRGNHDEAIITGDVSRFRTEHGKISYQWTKDHLDLESVGWIALLPNGVVGNKYSIFHGTAGDLWKNVFPKDRVAVYELLSCCKSKVVIIAHSHLQFKLEIEGRIILNPGSVGQSRNGCPEAHYAIIDEASDEIILRNVPYNISESANKIVAAGLPKFNATRLYLGI